MCYGPNKRDLFFERGRAKGWESERIERAWDAQQQRLALKDADILLTYQAPPPEPLRVGDLVNVKPTAHINYTSCAGAAILSLDGAEAWVKLHNGDRHTISLRHLERRPTIAPG